METLKALLEDYQTNLKEGDSFIVPDYENPINLIVSTNLTYEYLVEGYYVIVNDEKLTNFLKIQ